MRRQRRCFERLADRHLLTTTLANEICLAPQAAEVASQYEIHQPPRLQLGDAPLIGTPAFNNRDQVELLWQTRTIGDGATDDFQVQYRDISSDNWQPVDNLSQIDTGVETRIVHSAVIMDLNWNHQYEYVVQHLRAGELLDEYHGNFKTRLAPGDTTEFSFAAYGDSAEPGNNDGFRAVQGAINEANVDFGVLLGDNFYASGSHSDGDARFTTEQSPEATSWIAEHIDYFAIGNHDISSNHGQPSVDSYSMPQLEAGVDGYVSTPAGEQPAFFSSFDYGNAHFVTFDSNSAELSRGETRDERIQQQVDYLVADLEASDAQWKFVYMHHPMVGSLKLALYPDTNYLELMMPRLVDAGVDLVMSGDSHTYAWSYPIQGLDDRDANDEISDDEIVFDDGSHDTFAKGTGVVNLISGAGGRRLRNDPFGQPFMAQTHSTWATTKPLELGFAKVNVSSDQLRVEYISAETGEIFGDTNENGVRDATEENFAVFTIQAEQPNRFDLDGSGELDADDLDFFCAALHDPESDVDTYDFDDDGQISYLDFLELLHDGFDSRPGDVDLDTFFSSRDLVLAFQTGTYEQPTVLEAGWTDGDWNCDGRFDTSDFVTALRFGWDG